MYIAIVRKPERNGGFEKDRGALKKLCPAKRYGIKCQGMEQCSVSQGIRIPLAE
ncbi:IS5 family transposase, partial [Carboxydocella sp. JDF658]